MHMIVCAIARRTPSTRCRSTLSILFDPFFLRPFLLPPSTQTCPASNHPLSFSFAFANQIYIRCWSRCHGRSFVSPSSLVVRPVVSSFFRSWLTLIRVTNRVQHGLLVDALSCRSEASVEILSVDPAGCVNWWLALVWSSRPVRGAVVVMAFHQSWLWKRLSIDGRLVYRKEIKSRC